MSDDPVILGILSRTRTKEISFQTYFRRFSETWKGKPIPAYDWYIHLKKCHEFVRSYPADSMIDGLDLTMFPVYIRWKLAEIMPDRIANLLFDTYAYEHDSHRKQNVIIIQTDQKGYIYGSLSKLCQSESASKLQPLVRRYVLSAIYRLPIEPEAIVHTQNSDGAPSY